MGCNCGGSAKAKERREARQAAAKARPARVPKEQDATYWTGPKKNQSGTASQ